MLYAHICQHPLQNTSMCRAHVATDENRREAWKVEKTAKIAKALWVPDQERKLLPEGIVKYSSSLSPSPNAGQILMFPRSGARLISAYLA